MKAIASSTFVGFKKRSGSPHVLDYFSWPASADDKVRRVKSSWNLNEICQKESNSSHLLLDGFGTEDLQKVGIYTGRDGRALKEKIEHLYDCLL
ncbi:hypothetical protein SDJN03_18675, partial [Cucurbita argyrosperma subsp. sororia]